MIDLSRGTIKNMADIPLAFSNQVVEDYGTSTGISPVKTENALW